MSDEGMTGDWYSYGDVQRFIEAETETLRAKVETLEKDRDKYQALLLQSCRDNIEEFKVQCKPACDSYGHDTDCPAAHPGLVYDEMRQQLAAMKQERDEAERSSMEREAKP